MNNSVYRPFSWNFRDQGAEERAEIASLLSEARGYPVPDPAVTVRLVSEFIRPSALRAELVTLADKMVRLEAWIFEPAEYDLSQLNARQLIDLRALLRRKQYFHANEATVLEKLKQGVVRVVCGVQDGVPKKTEPSPFSVPLISIFPDAKANIQLTHNTLMNDEYEESGLFADLRRQLYRNLCLASNLIPDEPPKRAYKFASESDLPLEETAEAYLANTPFLDIFKATVPLPLSQEERFSHMHVVGGTGAGKTTLLQQLILHDLQSDDPPALVIVDGQTDLVRKLSRLHLFEDRLKDRLVLITPRDIEHPPAINIFDVNRSRLGSYSEETKEQVTAGVIQIFDYLFTGLLGADLTAKQGVFFRFVARLMLALPETMGRNATILDLLSLMTDPAPYRDAIRSLPPIPREFFERDFPSKTFTQTKEQIRYRLNAILENPTLARLFTSTSTKVDFFTELNRGSVILVDTAKDFLKGAVTFLAATAHKQFMHATMICACLASIELATRDTTGLRFIPWPEILSRAPEARRALPMPFRGPGGVIPDGLFGLEYTTDSTKAYRFFALEADRGTMPVLRSDERQTSYLGKLAAYRELIGNHLHRSHWGFSKLFVLTVTTDPQRLSDIITKSGAAGGSPFFLFKAASERDLRAPMPSFVLSQWLRASLLPIDISNP